MPKMHMPRGTVVSPCTWIYRRNVAASAFSDSMHLARDSTAFICVVAARAFHRLYLRGGGQSLLDCASVKRIDPRDLFEDQMASPSSSHGSRRAKPALNVAIAQRRDELQAGEFRIGHDSGDELRSRVIGSAL
jgi:hypothetical protein